MLDPAQPASLYAEIRDLKMRIAALERSPRVSYASIQDGAIVLLDASGNEVVKVGKMPSGAQGVLAGDITGEYTYMGEFISRNAYGFSLANDDSRTGFEVLTDAGWSSPVFAYGWRRSNDNFATSSASFVTAYETQAMTVTANCLRQTIVVGATDASLAGEIRVVTPDGTSAVKSFSSVVGGATYTLVWEHPLPLFSGPTGITVQVRKTGGVGDVSVFEPMSLAFQANLPGATTVGAWS